MRKYLDFELKKVQQTELSIFKDFAKICKDNNLTYWGLAGTGIGAIRHKGFIPWDDDIDVVMPYEDYVKLNKILMELYSDKYTVVNCENFSDYPGMNEHIILNGTKFITEDSKHLKYPQGIFLDVFPLFKSPVDQKLRMRHVKKTWILGKLLILRQIPFPNIPFDGISGKIVHCATFCCSCILKILFTHKQLYDLNLKTSLKYNDLEDYILEFYSDPQYGHTYFSKDTPNNLMVLPFEDTDMYFPKNIDESLRENYGDYMQLPPIEKRIGHAPLVVKFIDD